MKCSLRYMTFFVAASISLSVIGVSMYELITLTACDAENSNINSTVYSTDLWIAMMSSITSFWIGSITSRKLFVDSSTTELKEVKTSS